MSITHVAALDANHLHHRFEDGCLDLAAGRKTNDHDAAPGSDVLSSLLKGLLTGGNDESGMRSKTILCCLADIFDNVLGLGKVDKGLEFNRDQQLPSMAGSGIGVS